MTSNSERSSMKRTFQVRRSILGSLAIIFLCLAVGPLVLVGIMLYVLGYLDGLAVLVVVLGIVAGLIVAALLMRYAQNRIVEPLQQLADVVRDVNAGDSNRQVQMLRLGAGGLVDVRYQEIGDLAQTFNDMATQLHNVRADLERRVTTRTAELERRSLQLEAAARIAREATAIQDVDELLDVTVKLIAEQFGFYHTGLFLLDDSAEHAILRAASSEGGAQMIARGYRISVGSANPVGGATKQGVARVALNIADEEGLFDNPDLPDANSALALPLKARGQIIGALDVQSIALEAFGDEEVAVLQTLADQIAMAVSNVMLYQQAQESLEMIQRAYGETSQAAWGLLLQDPQQLGYRYEQGGVTPLEKADLSGSTALAESASADLPEIALPISLRGYKIGEIQAHKPEGAGTWTAEEATLLSSLAEQLEVALDSARLHQQTQNRAFQEQLIREVTAHMHETLEIDLMLKTAVRDIREALGLSSVSVRLAPQFTQHEGDTENLSTSSTDLQSADLKSP